ncbi:cytochrome c3 family protein [Thermodesulfobacteriota bacterium]
MFPIILVLMLLPLPVQAIDFRDCSDCHETILKDDSNSFYLHSPFKEEQCEKCHVVEAATSPQNEPTKNKGTVTRKNTRRIIWLEECRMPDNNHFFLLPEDKLGNTLVVELREINGRLSRQEITVPALFDITEVEDSGKQPVISKIKILEVKHGIFLSVTIGWQTDVLTDAIVQYGIQDLSQTSEPSTRLGRRHEVTLHNLQPESTYRFTAISNDLFGRSQVSEPLTFSTSESFKKKQSGNYDNMTGNEDEMDLSSNFQRLGADYLLELSLKQPASVMIGSRSKTMLQGLSDGSCNTGSYSAGSRNDEINSFLEEESHAGLSSANIISQNACQKCHQSRCTHPVNACPEPGMTINSQYPILTNGRITCISCHTSHSSNYAFLLRRPREKLLCVGCHQKQNKKRLNRN